MTLSDELPPDQRYADLRSRLERAVRAVCPQWSNDRRDDLVQSSLVKLMEIERKSEGNRHFSSSYLRRVAHSVVVDEVRRLRRRQETPLDDDPLVEVPTSPNTSPERHSAGREIHNAIRDCLGRLGRPRRLAVVLYLQGHTVPEASGLLGWAYKRTENLVYRGLARLRECLVAKGFEP